MELNERGKGEGGGREGGWGGRRAGEGLGGEGKREMEGG